METFFQSDLACLGRNPEYLILEKTSGALGHMGLVSGGLTRDEFFWTAPDGSTWSGKETHENVDHMFAAGAYRVTCRDWTLVLGLDFSFARLTKLVFPKTLRCVTSAYLHGNSDLAEVNYSHLLGLVHLTVYLCSNPQIDVRNHATLEEIGAFENPDLEWVYIRGCQKLLDMYFSLCDMYTGGGLAQLLQDHYDNCVDSADCRAGSVDVSYMGWGEELDALAALLVSEFYVTLNYDQGG